jgi:hypothetical protein
MRKVKEDFMAETSSISSPPPDFTGRGKFIDQYGQVYEGDYVKGKRQKKKKIIHTDGGSYEGEWAKDTLNGKGKLILSDGTIIQGTFKDGLFKK